MKIYEVDIDVYVHVHVHFGLGVGVGCTLPNTAVTCWVCFPSHSTNEYYQSTAEAWGSCSPQYFDFYVHDHVGGGGGGVGVGCTLSYTAVTCWVCFPSHSTSR